MKTCVNAVLISLAITVVAQAQNYSAMTYNIRYSTPNDGENQWELRKEWVASIVSFYEPDVLGIQEGLQDQVQYLDSVLTNYSYEGVGRDDGKEAGEYAAIFYKHDKLTVLDSGTFWLSETPDEPSYGWGANFRRISTWAKFRSKESGDTFWAFNVHLDHETPLARINGVKLIAEQIKNWNKENLPILLMGDFNATPESEPIKYLYSVLQDSKLKSRGSPIGPIGTYNGFDTSNPLKNRIDYIFVDESILVHKYAVISETRDNKTPSDHLPLYIQFSIK